MEQHSAVCKKYLPGGKAPFANCSRKELPDAAARQAFDVAVDYGTPIWLQATISATRQSFDVADATLAFSTQDRTGWRGKIALGWLLPAYNLFVGASGAREKSFTGAAAQQVCVPSTLAAEALQCKTAALTGPTETLRSTGQLELRVIRRGVALDPRVTYDFSNNVTAMELPLYFTPRDSKLSVGVSGGWRSDTDRHFTASVFVSQSLGIIPEL